jgi:ribosome-associated heat shock protein Hsp15
VSDEPVRIDKWLWAARFYKTRGLAIEAVKGGRIALNDERVKPSKDVRAGDRIEISLGQGRRIELVVRALSARRGPAKEAALLYEETEASVAAREEQRAQAKANPMPTPTRGIGRPTKRDRRRFDATRGRGR